MMPIIQLHHQTGVIGLLEGYTVMDLSAEYKFLKITILDLELIT
jgi:hypothetical protein